MKKLLPIFAFSLFTFHFSYAHNFGLGYGNELSFKTNAVPPPTDSVTDKDGNTYPTVTIGMQVWMAENLRTTRYRDSSKIQIVTDSRQWSNNWNNSKTLPMMCWYNNDKATYTNNKMGALYNWYAINPATNGNKNVCPTGWHVPSDDEWTTLINFLDRNADGGNYNPNTAGAKMKSKGTQYWLSPNQDANNSSGFSGLPGGSRGSYASFSNISNYGYWWSSTENLTYSAKYRYMDHSTGNVYRNSNDKAIGYSVRCLKD